MKLEHESYCAMPSPSAPIKHTESDKVLSQVCVHVRVRKSPPCPLDVTGKEDFTGSGEVKSWKQQELRRRFKKKKAAQYAWLYSFCSSLPPPISFPLLSEQMFTLAFHRM